MFSTILFILLSQQTILCVFSALDAKVGLVSCSGKKYHRLKGILHQDVLTCLPSLVTELSSLIFRELFVSVCFER